MEMYQPYESAATFVNVVISVIQEDIYRFLLIFVPLLFGFATAINALAVCHPTFNSRWASWWLTVENLLLLTFIGEPPTIYHSGHAPYDASSDDDVYPTSAARLFGDAMPLGGGDDWSLETWWEHGRWPSSLWWDQALPAASFFFLFVLFLLVTVILLVNLLIAMISGKYEQVESFSTREYRIAFGRLVLRCERLYEQLRPTCGAGRKQQQQQEEEEEQPQPRQEEQPLQGTSGTSDRQGPPRPPHALQRRAPSHTRLKPFSTFRSIKSDAYASGGRRGSDALRSDASARRKSQRRRTRGQDKPGAGQTYLPSQDLFAVDGDEGAQSHEELALLEEVRFATIAASEAAKAAADAKQVLLASMASMTHAAPMTHAASMAEAGPLPPASASASSSSGPSADRRLSELAGQPLPPLPSVALQRSARGSSVSGSVMAAAAAATARRRKSDGAYGLAGSRRASWGGSGGGSSLEEELQAVDMEQQIACAQHPPRTHRTTSLSSAGGNALAYAACSLIRSADTDDDMRLDEGELASFLTRVFRVPSPSQLPADELAQLRSDLDADGDGFISCEELRSWALGSKHFPPGRDRPVHALLIVDVQNDFISGTLSLKECEARQDGAEVVPVINSLREEAAALGTPFGVVACSLDWHPRHHCSFHEDVTDPEGEGTPDGVVVLHPSQDPTQARASNPFDKVLLRAPQPPQMNVAAAAPPLLRSAAGTGAAASAASAAAAASAPSAAAATDGAATSTAAAGDEDNGDDAEPMTQVLWPRHCVQHTEGAALHPGLCTGPGSGPSCASDLLVYKGTNPRVDSFSAFFDNSRLEEPRTAQGTTLQDELRMRGVTHVYVCGLALDVCVYHTAIDAKEAGFCTSVVTDACRGVNRIDIEQRMREMGEAGIALVRASEVPHMMAGRTLSDALADAIKAAMDSEQEAARRQAARDAAYPSHSVPPYAAAIGQRQLERATKGRAQSLQQAPAGKQDAQRPRAITEEPPPGSLPSPSRTNSVMHSSHI